MRSWVVLVFLLAAACRTPPLDADGGAPPPPPGSDLAVARDLAGHPRDMAATRDLSGPPTSCCATPGNPGNELGVGKYCDTQSDCANQKANLCATIADPNAHFCTLLCTQGGGNAQCGSGALCQCGANGQCGCVPGECVMPPPGC